MADDKQNGKRAEPHDDKKKAEDMIPSPTQAELDERAGETGKKEKGEREKAAASRKQEDLTPTPTQAENDEIRAKAFNTTVEEDKKRREEHAKATLMSAKEGEDLTPTPTQAECDQAKLDAMYIPEGAGDPQKAGAAKAPPQNRRMEAERPGGYQTRAVEPAPAPAPARAE